MSMRKLPDLSGKRYGKLVVKNVVSSVKGKRLWKCMCDCGNETAVLTGSLTSGNTKSCGCLVVESRISSKRLLGNERAKNIAYTGIRQSAKNRELTFSLSKNEFLHIVSQSCCYCGIEPSQITKPQYKSCTTEQIFLHNGIDRVDSSKGYTIDNCVPCCRVCNYAKHTLSVEQFKTWIKRVYINQFKKVTNKTPGELIDSLVTIDIKCFYEQEKIMGSKGSLSAAKKAQELNARRNKLIRSIDAVLDFEDDTPIGKTYGN